MRNTAQDGPVHVSALIGERIASLAKYARSDEEIRAYEERTRQAQDAQRVASMDGGQRFERELADVIRQHEPEGAAAVRDAAITFITDRVAALYDVDPEREAVEFVVQFHGPKVAKEVAAGMLREGRDGKVRNVFAVFKARALRLRNKGKAS